MFVLTERGLNLANRLLPDTLRLRELVCMSSFVISLPEEFKNYVDERVTSGNFASAGEFIASLIERDFDRDGFDLEARLIAAEKEPAIPVPQSVLESGELLTYLRSQLQKL